MQSNILCVQQYTHMLHVRHSIDSMHSLTRARACTKKKARATLNEQNQLITFSIEANHISLSNTMYNKMTSRNCNEIKCENKWIEMCIFNLHQHKNDISQWMAAESERQGEGEIGGEIASKQVYATDISLGHFIYYEPAYSSVTSTKVRRFQWQNSIGNLLEKKK